MQAGDHTVLMARRQGRVNATSPRNDVAPLEAK